MLSESKQMDLLFSFPSMNSISDFFFKKMKRYGIESIVFVQEKDKPSQFEYDEKAQALKASNLTIKLFDKVIVEISIDEAKSAIKLACVSPALHLATAVSTEAETSKKVLKEGPEIEEIIGEAIGVQVGAKRPNESPAPNKNKTKKLKQKK